MKFEISPIRCKKMKLVTHCENRVTRARLVAWACSVVKTDVMVLVYYQGLESCLLA